MYVVKGKLNLFVGRRYKRNASHKWKARMILSEDLFLSN